MNKYEMVIGLEVHAELKTRTKIFCGCPASFGAQPNTHVCPVCAGLPGALPVLNRSVVEFAVRAGLLAHCEIANFSLQDRKNYFYPDLPKAYQISQYELPLCGRGFLLIDAGAGEKKIGLTRIHIEEDAGKLIHENGAALIDLNRCGVPLIEIVSEPDLRSADEAVAYLKALRETLVESGVSECRMNEGSMRADVNLSVRLAGETHFGTRAEIKNLNSFDSARRAIDSEFKRQVALIEAGGAVVQETRRFDAKTGKTQSMRGKENADDYRYFPDPDLPPIRLTPAQIEKIARETPKKQGICAQAEKKERKKATLVSREQLIDFVRTVIRQETALCASYRSGREQAMKGLIGQLMKATRGEADPGLAETLFREELREK